MAAPSNKIAYNRNGSNDKNNSNNEKNGNDKNVSVAR
jgi:hypothetical protein